MATETRHAITWLAQQMGLDVPLLEGAEATVRDVDYVVKDSIIRQRNLARSADQNQTSDAFGYKWQRRDTYESAAALAAAREWLVARYGDMTKESWLFETSDHPVVFDAGCGSAMSAIELFGPVMHRIRYIGSDISAAVDVARDRFVEKGMSGAFVQADILEPPCADGSVDVVFSEGVMHHTDSTERALKRLARLLRPGGRFLFYVYRRKGPIREYADDLVRDRLLPMSNDEAWAALMPLTKLGKALGDLDAVVDIPEDVDILDIPAGKISVQRLFYWHVFKAFYRPDMTLDEMNHVNFDWYTPLNAHRQSPEEVAGWCAAANLEIERMDTEESGITVIARMRA